MRHPAVTKIFSMSGARRPARLALAIAAAVLPATLLAQTVEFELPPMHVTAKGYAADENQTPISTTSIERDQLLQRNAQNLGDALRGEPGLAIASDGAQGQNPVIRGLKKESVVLLVDGMRLNSAQPAGAVGSFMSLGLAERVEVVKGPASVLYGTGALGGVVNVLLPQARFEPGSAVSTIASWDSASRGVRGTGLLNASSGGHALMLGASLARIEDYRAPDARVRRTGYDSDSFIGQYRLRIDAAQQLRVSLQQHVDEDVWYPGSTKPFTHPMPGVAAAVASTTIHSPRQTRELAELGYSYKGSGERPLNLDLRVYRQEMERTIYAWSNRLLRDITTTRVSFDTDGFDARGDWQAHAQHLVSFGTNLWQMDASPKRLNAIPPNGINFQRTDPFTDGRIRALGVYVQDDMHFGRLDVLAALRHDTVKGDADSIANSANPLGPRRSTDLDRRDNAFSGSLGAVYEVSSLLRPYANLSRGFRAGEMRERYESSPRGDGYFYVGNPQTKPEIATQIEIGLKGQNEAFAYELALWRNRITDYMSGLDISGTPRAAALCGPNAGACKETVNISKVTLHGFEAQARWEVTPDHTLKANLSLVRGRNDALHEPLFQMPADELGLGWEGHVAPGWTLDASARFVRRQNRLATVFSRGSENRTSGYTTFDMGANWRYAQNQSLHIGAKNLFDRSYHEHLTEGISGQEIDMPGRSLVLAWKGEF